MLHDLLGGVDLSSEALRTRDDAEGLAPLIGLLDNAEYWLSFELAPFEPLLAYTPSPLRELAVGLTLRFGESIDGRLHEDEIHGFSASILGALPADVAGPLEQGIESLRRAVAARERTEEILSSGFAEYRPPQALSVHALLAKSKALLRVDGKPLSKKSPIEVEIGRPVVISAADESGKALESPTVESELNAPVLARRDDPAGTRTVLFQIPGRYRVRVPGRLEGDGVLLAR